MTDTPEIIAKKAHAVEILTALDSLKDLIESEPLLWFGGLPPALIQIVNLVEHGSSQLRERFQLTSE